MATAKGSKVSEETQADSPTVESGQDSQSGVNGGTGTSKPVRTLVHRGQQCPIHKTTRDTRTGAIHDYFTYKRPVMNRRTGEQTIETVGKRKRRPGTGATVEREVVIEE